MTVLVLTLLVWLGSAIAGFLGALTGLGGGVVIVPLLTLVFGVDIRYAIGASLVSVIATSSGAAAAYVREGYTNIRIGMFLEIATTLGAVLGAFLAAKVSTSAIAIIFGAVLLYSAYLSARVRVRTKSDEIPDALATRLRLNGNARGYLFTVAANVWHDHLRKEMVRRRAALVMRADEPPLAPPADARLLEGELRV